MSLNIKSDEAHRMARELARLRGTNMTEAVTAALSASLDSAVETVEPDVLLHEIRDIQRFVANLPESDGRSSDEILGYDERGLPG